MLIIINEEYSDDMEISFFNQNENYSKIFFHAKFIDFDILGSNSKSIE